ncbi:MAG: hypothetical protein QM696_02830 [Steroidobacteraceae bacterium]
MSRVFSRLDIANCPLYGISPLTLTSTFRLPPEIGDAWKQRLRAIPSDAAAIARYVNRDLGAFDSAWVGWICMDGLLWPPDFVPVDPGQVRAIPLRQAQLKEYEWAAQRKRINAASAGA